MLPQAIHQIKQSFAPMRKRADHDAAHPFTMISNATINDGALTLAALGALTWLLSQPDDAPITVDALAPRAGSRHAARAILRQLETAGYLRRAKHRTAAGRIVTRAELSETADQPSPHRQTHTQPTTRDAAGRFIPTAVIRPPVKSGAEAASPTAAIRPPVTDMAQRVTDSRNTADNYPILGGRQEVDPVPPPDPVFSAGTAARNATTQNRTQPTPAETGAEQTPAPVLAELIAVGVLPATAGALVAAFPADHVAAHIAAFRADLAAGQQIKAGALVYRIKNAPAPVLADDAPDAEERKRARFAEIAGALAAPAAQEAPGDTEPAPAVPEHPAAPQTAAHRQRQPAAPAAHRQHSAPAAPARQPDPAPALADDAPAQLWRQVLRSLAGADPHMARLLENSTLHDTGADWSIHLADAAGADWLQSRAARRLSQEIALYDPDRQRRPVTIAAPLAPNHAQEATAYA